MPMAAPPGGRTMQPPDRLHALDAVRAYALLLGVVLHAAAAFLEGFPVPIWYVEPSTGAAVIFYVIHMFRMSAFFLIAGFFARMVVERRGVMAFVKDRGKRIAIPLVVFGPVVLVLMGAGLALGAIVHGLDFFQEIVGRASAPPAASAGPEAAGGDTAHLWFLYYLLIFYALALTLRAGIGALDPQGRVAALADRIVAFVMGGMWAPALIALPLVAWFARAGGWNEWGGLPAPFDFVPNADALVGYGVAFGLGWLLHRQIHLLLDLHAHWYVYLGAAVALTVVCLRIAGVTPVWRGPSLEGAERLIYTAAYMAGLWCWVFAFVGAAVRFLSQESPVTRYLADASYWIYLVHMTTIMFFITVLRPYDWHWSIKFFVFVAGSMPILLASYHYLVRFTWLGAVLNGRRHPRPGTPRGQNVVPAAG
jgi:fucose 4-O-acetylase-like acetyltransferase